MNIVDIAKMKKLAGGGAAVVVDKLPEKDIKPNTIYAVKKYDYYTSIYGTKMPTFTLENKDTWSKTAVEICSAKGLTKEEIQALGMAADTFGFAVSDYLVHDNGIDYISKNIFDSGLFVWECARNQTGMTQDQFSIKRSFNTVVELYEYLLSENFVKDVDEADSEAGDLSLFASGVVDTLKSLNFKYQTTPLTADEIGVVFETTYEYYIYNGEKWINLGTDNKPVITKNVDWNNGNPIPQLEALTFTTVEFDSLKNNAELEIICNMSNKPLFTMYANKTLLTDSDVAGGIEYEITVVGAFSTKRCRMMLTNKNGKIEVDIVEPTNVTSSYTTIPVSAWTEGGSGVYKHSAFTNVGDVETQSRVIVMFGKNDAESGNFSPYVDTVDGGLTIYAKEKPTTDVSIHVEVFN